ncbi:hypothetical protein NECAME_09284 [Necator americanus]|uniref:Uncharacterized protein n=1 Tax=Necator americanus TaxID=51031 RepID=W2TGC0_NECAM|nr:hypothetical protein NECAME_09284 [Necator americanus]ETN80231.1 hypothetical protein NECAME_09284 [Necator americanus]
MLSKHIEESLHLLKYKHILFDSKFWGRIHATKRSKARASTLPMNGCGYPRYGLVYCVHKDRWMRTNKKAL